MNRTTAREIAMHLIYEMDYHEDMPEEILERVFCENYYPSLAAETDLYLDFPDPKQEQYIRTCVQGVYAYKAEIDAAIEKYAIGWRLERISKVTLAVLRLAIFEIDHIDDADTATVINEAVEIARRYEEDDKVSFINGILGSYVRAE